MIRYQYLWLAALLLVVLMQGATVYAGPEGPAPYQLVRSLQDLQNRVASGNRAAYDEQPKLIAQIAEAFGQMDPSVWLEPRNTQAAAIFLFSGGPVRPVRALFAAGKIPAGKINPRNLQLLNGALAFSEGREVEARKYLDPIDAESIAGGGQLALVQAGLVLHQEPAKAIRLLELASLLSPGTLVEEASMRRRIYIYDETRNVEKYGELAKKYLRRYANSIYAVNFMSGFQKSAVRFFRDNTPGAIEMIFSVLAEMPKPQACDLAVELSRIQVIAARLEPVRQWISQVEGMCGEGSVQAQRLALFAAIADLFSKSSEPTRTRLLQSDLAVLPMEDRYLVEAALAVQSKIKSMPDAAELPNPGKSEADVKAASAVSRAELALSQTQAIVEATGP